MKYSITFFQKCCCKLRNFRDQIFGEKRRYLSCEHDPNKAADIIIKLLESPNPCMIARFGSTELYCLTNYLAYKKGFIRSFFPFIFANGEPWWIMPQRVRDLINNSGFFSAYEDQQIESFCELMLSDIKYLDVLGSWVHKECLIEDQLININKIFLPYLEPYYATIPWTMMLKGKKVLVVHPFANQIKRQYYQNRTKIFKHNDILPDFRLEVIAAVQSLGGEANGFHTWFEALQSMKDEIDKVNYDICIIGCGAYGFHLAAHVKRSGKKAIHLGGATQLLFGIKGNRWENPMYGVKEWGLPYGFYTDMFNDYWVKPGSEGRPRNAEEVEGACYW